MPKKALMFTFAFSLLFSFLFIFPFSFQGSCKEQANAIQQNNFRVRNLNTSENYSTIQEAIDAPETLDGHEIFVASGIYYEHLNVSKSLSLIGEDQGKTIIDGNGEGKVVFATADNVEVRNFTIQNGAFGLTLHNSSNSKIIGNKLREGSYGLRLYNSRNAEVIGNEISGYTWFGVEIRESGNTTLRDNSMVENKYTFGVNGNSLFDFINDIDISNTVNGKPVHYLINQHNITIDASTFQEIGYLGLVNSTNIKVKNLNVQDSKQGILCAFTADSSISNVNARNNWDGIYIAHSSNISLGKNNANNNFDYGIKFFNSSRSKASRNNVDNNGWAGIGLFQSPNSTVDQNEANFNTYNLHFAYTNNSVVTGNNALAIKPNGYSIAVFYSHNNIIYQNNLANSLLHIETRNGTPFIPKNIWDNELEGNYWSLYKGIDEDQDGIGDTSYVVRGYNVDNHPLMGKFHGFTVNVGEKDYSVTIISNSSISQFQFSPDDIRISFKATGEKGTTGFSRIAVQNNLLQNLPDGNLSFFVNGEQPVMERKWTNETRTYFYFSYMNRASESAISPWITVALASAFLIEFVLVFLVLKKKLGEG